MTLLNGKRQTMTRHGTHIATAIVMLLVNASLALGAASLTIDASDSGNGIFTVQGNDMGEVAAIDITLSYDAAALGSPSVSQGSLISGAIMAANTNNPGSIKIGIARLSPFSGSGPIVTVTFAKHTGGSVNIASSTLTDVNGNDLSPEGSAPTPGANATPGTPSPTTPTTNSATNPTTTPPASSPGGSGPTSLGTVTMPSDSQPQNEAKPAPAPETAAKPAETPAPAQTPAPAETSAPAAKRAEAIDTTANIAVLERFLDYHGAKTPAILIALFKQPISPYFRQEPFVALSDGTTTVTIVADLSAVTGRSPNFALNGAKLVSLKQDGVSSTWFIEALPAKGALSASLMVLSDSHVIEYPLTIAPAIPNAAATEAEFAAFLKDAAKTPAQHDLNGDGKYDGIDDYIYTANYLVRQQKTKPTAK